MAGVVRGGNGCAGTQVPVGSMADTYNRTLFTLLPVGTYALLTIDTLK